MKRQWFSTLFVLLAFAGSYSNAQERSKEKLEWSASLDADDLTETASCVYDSTVNAILCKYLQSPNMELLVQALQETSQFVDSFGVNIQNSNGPAIPTNIFNGYNIVFLVLSYNNFTTVPYTLLSSIESPLDYLDISFDNIASLPATNLYLPFSVFLTQLYIMNSGVSAVNLATFAQYANLKTLSLSDNELTAVGLEYMGLEKLEELDLQHCQLSSIETGAFRDLGKLKSILLNDNEFVVLQEGAFLGIENSLVSEINLGNNPFNCTCQLQWLKDWLDVRNLTASSKANCAYPVFAPFPDVDFCPSNEENDEENDGENDETLEE